LHVDCLATRRLRWPGRPVFPLPVQPRYPAYRKPARTSTSTASPRRARGAMRLDPARTRR